MSEETISAPAGFARRMGAIVYDGLLLAAIWFLATIPALALNGGHVIEPGNVYFAAYLAAIAYFYFAWQWCHGGQTLGMKAWQLRLRDARGGRVGWKGASLRFFAALVSWSCAGLGFLWSLSGPQRLAWHDRWSFTRLRVEPAAAKTRPASGNPPEQHDPGGDDQ